MKKIYTIEPILEERIWGGKDLIENWNLKTELENVAEMYLVIAIPGHLDCRVTECDMPLSEFYEKFRKELFQCAEEALPIRLVAGSSRKPLSIHLHPDDAYALEHEQMLGKPEGELLLGEGEFDMLLGHYAKTREEFRKLAEEKNWDRLLRKIQVHGGDYIDMPAGTLHGSLGEGMVVAFSRNGDVTYRLYDYERRDEQGNLRPLHVEKVIENVNIPDAQIGAYPYKKAEEGNCIHSYLYDKPGLYTCGRLQITESFQFEMEEFYFLSCIGGSGMINKIAVKPGETKFIPCNFGEILLEGDLDLVYITFRASK